MQQHLFPQEQPLLDRITLRAPKEAAESMVGVSRQAAIGLLLIAALLAFEVFNFDTTRFALTNLLGDVNFGGLRWASILALAFCAIDFAGLAHLFGPGRQADRSLESWYLMGAWLLGATMNALMTWWAVNLTLLNHQLGNEVLSREQLLDVVPTFVAVLVWLTRILFIGAFSVAGDRFFQSGRGEQDDTRPDRRLRDRQVLAENTSQDDERRPLREPASNTPYRSPARRSIPGPPQPTSFKYSAGDTRKRQRV